MSVFTRTVAAGRQRAAISVDFTEVLLMIGLAIGSKSLGLW